MNDLQDAWVKVAEVPGPALGDRRAPLEERNRAFRDRIAAFRAVMR